MFKLKDFSLSMVNDQFFKTPIDSHIKVIDWVKRFRRILNIRKDLPI